MSKDIAEKFLKDHYLPKPETLLSLTTPEEIENATNILILGNIGNLVCKEGGKAKSYVATNSDAYRTHLALIRRIIKSEKRTVFVISSTLRREMGKYLKLVAGIRDIDDLSNTIFYTADFTKKDFSDNFFIMEKDVKFNLILANPPFDGSLGREITKAVLENIDFDNYINLMPVSKYNKGDLYQHIIRGSLKPIEWEGDASTNPQICKLSKKRDNSITEEEFNVWCYDPRFEKFYGENVKRQRTWGWKGYIVGSGDSEQSARENIKSLGANPDTSFMFTMRTVENGVHITENCWDYKWNVLKNLKIEDIHITYDKALKCYHSTIGFFFFDNVDKMNNFKNWWYSKGKKSLCNNLLWGLHKQAGTPEDAIPKVDWSRPWTDEEILKDYGYTDEEIKELLK